MTKRQTTREGPGDLEILRLLMRILRAYVETDPSPLPLALDRLGVSLIHVSYVSSISIFLDLIEALTVERRRPAKPRKRRAATGLVIILLKRR